MNKEKKSFSPPKGGTDLPNFSADSSMNDERSLTVPLGIVELMSKKPSGQPSSQETVPQKGPENRSDHRSGAKALPANESFLRGRRGAKAPKKDDEGKAQDRSRAPASYLLNDTGSEPLLKTALQT